MILERMRGGQIRPGLGLGIETYHYTSQLEIDMARESASFGGAVTTTGRSEALRLEKSFFRANPEFRQRAKVRAHVIGPGHILISVEEEAAGPDAPEEIRDPVVAAYLAFLEHDMAGNPERLTTFSADELDRLAGLVRGVTVADGDPFPEDVTF